MKIAYLIPRCAVSGGLAVICQHVNHLLERGHQVFLLSLEPPLLIDWFPNQRVPVCDINDWSEPLDILVATEWSTSFWLLRVPAKVKCYFVQSDETRFHPLDSRWRHLAALTYYFGVNYLTEAKWIKRWLEETFGHQVELVPNGLDPKIFHPAEPLESRGCRPRVLLEGAINLPYKGMAEAFATVETMDVEVWCVSSYGIPKPGWRCDRFFEHVPMTEMRRIYSSCDILLKLSRVEGFFGPPMEMMACGGVSVVGKVTGYDEYIEDGVNALVVEPEDISGARAAVQRLIDDPGLKARLIKGGSKTVAEWDWDKSIDILDKYYLRLLSTPECWAAHGRRAEFDRSISYAYDFMSSGVLPEDLASKNHTLQAPHHAYVLAAYLASNRFFWIISGSLRTGYKLYKRLRVVWLHILGRAKSVVRGGA